MEGLGLARMNFDAQNLLDLYQSGSDIPNTAVMPLKTLRHILAETLRASKRGRDSIRQDVLDLCDSDMADDVSVIVLDGKVKVSEGEKLMDERIKGFLETIRDEVHVLLSGMPSDDATTLGRLDKISDASMDAEDLVRNRIVNAGAKTADVGALAGAAAGLMGSTAGSTTAGPAMKPAQVQDDLAGDLKAKRLET